MTIVTDEQKFHNVLRVNFVKNIIINNEAVINK